MSERAARHERTPANLVAAARAVLAAALLVTAFVGLTRAFVAALALSLVGALAGSSLAPVLGRPSRWGARLEPWAAAVAIASVPLGSTWLRPELAHSDALTYWGLVAAIAVPIIFAFIKYGTVSGYRARAARIAACVVMGAAALLFAGGPMWPLRLATALLAVAALEEIAIIALLPRPAPAASLPIALRVRRQQMADADE
jgi:cardiolipin synthase (CMP-forming)